MDFKKKFDYNDITNFLPDNMTLGTSSYFSKKYNLPSYMCEMLEVKPICEHTGNEEVLLNEIRERQTQHDQKLLNEFKERSSPNRSSDNDAPLNDTTPIQLEDAKWGGFIPLAPQKLIFLS